MAVTFGETDMITIPRKMYEELVVAANFLDALEAAGVDNWDGYQLAKEAME